MKTENEKRLTEKEIVDVQAKLIQAYDIIIDLLKNEKYRHSEVERIVQQIDVDRYGLNETN